MSANQIDVDFASAWNESQGSFSAGVANNILSYCDQNNRHIKTALDICCGASNLLNVFNERGIKCVGTETRDGMIEFSSQKYPSIKFVKTKNMYDIPLSQKFDLITCNHDIVNYFENFDEWKLFFKNVSKHLTGKGLFVFDFYTKHKLQNWNETTYFASPSLDCLTDVKSGIYDKTMITYTYYIKYENYVRKTRDIAVECYYDNNQIIEELKNAGFKVVNVVDRNLNPLENINYAERIHIVAMKK